MGNFISKQLKLYVKLSTEAKKDAKHLSKKEIEHYKKLFKTNNMQTKNLMVVKHLNEGRVTAVYVDKKTNAVILLEAFKEKFKRIIKIMRIFTNVITDNLVRVFNSVIDNDEYDGLLEDAKCDIVDFKTGRKILTI